RPAGTCRGVSPPCRRCGAGIDRAGAECRGGASGGRGGESPRGDALDDPPPRDRVGVLLRLGTLALLAGTRRVYRGAGVARGNPRARWNRRFTTVWACLIGGGRPRCRSAGS